MFCAGGAGATLGLQPGDRLYALVKGVALGV